MLRLCMDPCSHANPLGIASYTFSNPTSPTLAQQMSLAFTHICPRPQLLQALPLPLDCQKVGIFIGADSLPDLVAVVHEAEF